MTNTFFQVLTLNIFAIGVVSCSGQIDLSEETSALNLLFDVKTICEVVPQKYAYYESRAPHWPETCERAEKEASSLDGTKGSLAILERMIDDLYDPHISLNTHNQYSPRLVPTGSDMWVERIEGNYIVSAVRRSSGAANAGIRVGDKLVSFNELTPSALALTRIHSGENNVTEERMTWAINAAIAGKRVALRNIKVLRGDNILSFTMDSPEVPQLNEPILYKNLSENLGYIRFNNSLGNSNSVLAFNTALNALRQTDGLIIDLRETPSGGNTGVAEPILGRFIEKITAYQRTVLLNGSAKDRKIKPSGSWTYDKPVIVLVGRWTGSMGEGMAVGFDGMQRGKVMGSQMAGLAGGTEPIKLKETGVSFNFPTYDLHHLNGTPRHDWTPSELITADNGNDADILMRSAILTLQKKPR